MEDVVTHLPFLCYSYVTSYKILVSVSWHIKIQGISTEELKLMNKIEKVGGAYGVLFCHTNKLTIDTKYNIIKEEIGCLV